MRAVHRVLMVVSSLSVGLSAYADHCCGGGGFCPAPTMTLLVGFPAGGSTDAAARLLADSLGRTLSKTVIVVNRAGGGGLIAAGAAAAPGVGDGCTFLVARKSTVVITRLARSGSAVDPLRDLLPLVEFGETPNVLLVHSGLGARGFEDLRRLAAGRQLSYASTGAGTFGHLAGSLLSSTIRGQAMQHVPYQGGAPALTDLTTGSVQLGWFDIPSAMPHIKAGLLIPLIVTGNQRVPGLPNVPHAAEAGLPALLTSDSLLLMSAIGPMSRHIGDVSSAVQRALADPDVRRRLDDMSVRPVQRSGDELKRRLDDEARGWELHAEQAGIRLR